MIQLCFILPELTCEGVFLKESAERREYRVAVPSGGSRSIRPSGAGGAAAAGRPGNQDCGPAVCCSD